MGPEWLVQIWQASHSEQEMTNRQGQGCLVFIANVMALTFWILVIWLILSKLF